MSEPPDRDSAERRVGAAIGIVMTRLEVAYDDAERVLHILSETSDRTLHDVAEDVIQTGEFGFGARMKR